MAIKRKKGYLQTSAGAPALLLDRSVKLTKKTTNQVANNKVVKRPKSYWNSLGPGLITEAAGQDPSGIATFSQTGAQYGFHFLWLSVWLWPLDSVITSMCARIGLVTGKGLAANIHVKFGSFYMASNDQTKNTPILQGVFGTIFTPLYWWAREDLNLQTLRHYHLKVACLPISPLALTPC